MINKVKFDALRKRYLKAADALANLEIALSAKYGLSSRPDWYTGAERKKLTALRERIDKATDAFTGHLGRISPRDWSYGVPVRWICETLSYEDAVRPTSEPLSVRPPLAYGATQARR